MTSANPTATASGAATATRQERKILEEGDITITSARFMVPGQTYAMSGVTAVRASVFVPSKKGPLITIALGTVGVLVGFSQNQVGSILLGIVLIAVGILWWRSKKNVYSVRLTSASGEADAFSSKDAPFVQRLVEAVNEAIVHRG